jgi:hypothetical protein
MRRLAGRPFGLPSYVMDGYDHQSYEYPEYPKYFVIVTSLMEEVQDQTKICLRHDGDSTSGWWDIVKQSSSRL